MSAPDQTLLIDTPELRATFIDAGASARPLVITFDSLTHDFRVDRPAFGQGWLTALGYDAIHVVPRDNEWYQSPRMGELFPRLRALAAAHPRAVTYGSSMGAYAAVRFAGRSGAQAAIALSPQYSIDPRRAAFDDRWREHARGLEFLWEDPAPEDAALEAAYVFFDPKNADRLHVEALARDFPIVPVPLPFAGHPVGSYLTESGVLQDTVVGIVEGVFDPEAMRAAARKGRRQSAHYLSLLGQAQPRRRARWAGRLAAEAARLRPDAAHFLMNHALCLEADGALEEAERLLRRAFELWPEHPRFRLALAGFLARHERDAEEARALVHDIGRFKVELRNSHAEAAEVLFLVGDFDGALTEGRRARDIGLTSARASEVAWLERALRVPWAGRRLVELARRYRLARLRARKGQGRRRA